MVKDQVCGMLVDRKSAPYVSNYNGVACYFCSVGEKAKSDLSSIFSALQAIIVSALRNKFHTSHRMGIRSNPDPVVV
jgi:YHS domain-containing protein